MDELDGDHQHDIEEGARRLQALMERIPDLSVEIRDVIAEKNTVVVRGVWSGTEVDTGKALEFHGFVQWRIRDGKLVERWATVTPLAEVSEMSQRW
jgi:predicted ester cyclase